MQALILIVDALDNSGKLTSPLTQYRYEDIEMTQLFLRPPVYF